MFNSSNCASVPLVANLGGNNGTGWGNDGSWLWFIIVIIAIFGGWGNFGGGYGGNGANGSTSVYEGYVLNNDMSILNKAITDQGMVMDRKFEGISNGICSLGYDQLAQMNGINTNIMQGTNTLQGAIKDCCCQTQQNIADVKYTIGSANADTNYNISTQANMLDRTVSDKFCQTNFNNANNTRDIIDVQRADTQAILQKLDTMETNRLREKLEAERDARYALQGQLDRAQLRTDIVNDVRPCPKPAYITCNPFGCNCQQNVYGTTIA